MEPLLTSKERAQMQKIDLHTVDPSSLNDLHDVFVDIDTASEKTISDFIQQIKNPYCFRYGKIVVQLSFSDSGKTLEECLEEVMELADK